MIDVDIDKLLNVGVALTREKSFSEVFRIILDAAMDITRCDGGTLYTLNTEGNVLEFKIMITRSRGYCKGAHGEAVDLPPVPLNAENVCAAAAITGELINVPDVYNSTDYDFSGPRRYDAITGYKTVSQLVVPMKNNDGDIIGVLQLINAQSETGDVIPFSSAYERIIASLSSQAAITLTNMNYEKEVEELLYSFVRVMSAGIDARTPYNANHTRNMAHYGEGFLAWLRTHDEGPRFTEQDEKEIIMSIWLHDIGKLVIPLEVMDKSSRLGSDENELKGRFSKLGLLLKIELLEGKLSQDEYEKRLSELKEDALTVEQANSAPFLSDELLDKITSISKKSYIDENGNSLPLLSEQERDCLTVRKGTLTSAERGVMESHVTMTEKMLDEMHFPKSFEDVKFYASAHHEYINGRGYPKHLSAADLPAAVRIITILDVFDALTARDRPYKKPIPADRAFQILESMANDGQLDGELLELFKKSGAY